MRNCTLTNATSGSTYRVMLSAGLRCVTTLACGAAILVVAGCASRTDLPSAGIQSVLDEQARAWSAGDIDGYMKGYWKSDELEFITPNGTTRGWHATRDRYKAKYDTPEKMGTLTFSDLNYHFLSTDEAQVEGRYKLIRANGPTDTGRFQLLFRRLDGAWRIIRDTTVGD